MHTINQVKRLSEGQRIKMQYVVNLTTKEYIACENLNNRDNKLLILLKKLDKKIALTKSDIGHSRWNRTDNIVIAPDNLNTYIERYYSLIDL